MPRGGIGHRRKMENGEISVIPLIALFVILVTFLVATASSVAVSRFPVDVPVVGAAAEGQGEDGERYLLVVHLLPDAFLVRDTDTEDDVVQVRIERSGAGDAGALDALEQVLTGIRAERPDQRNVILIPDPAIPYEQVVETADRARGVGLTHLSLASRAPGGATASEPNAQETGNEEREL